MPSHTRSFPSSGGPPSQRTGQAIREKSKLMGVVPMFSLNEGRVGYAKRAKTAKRNTSNAERTSLGTAPSPTKSMEPPSSTTATATTATTTTTTTTSKSNTKKKDSARTETKSKREGEREREKRKGRRRSEGERESMIHNISLPPTDHFPLSPSFLSHAQTTLARPNLFSVPSWTISSGQFALAVSGLALLPQPSTAHFVRHLKVEALLALSLSVDTTLFLFS
ncbi:hypothetical protein K457DRAFT_132458 [Linnemannia elongata AG-77]|uniref:Uncharacterized protein n=1 Tax=Linnemannia elongata AG-77 TaxID=1314771 RepID=A0A197KF30_9FUNG|nr:hypothetical protein K457DRAFT_132458 [Linnemannia elongata AG-77]